MTFNAQLTHYEDSTLNAHFKELDRLDTEQEAREQEEDNVYSLIDRLRKRDSDCREAADIIEKLWEKHE